mgnify:CR=1 FL=1
MSAHLELLDTYAGLGAAVASYGEAYREWQAACVELKTIREQSQERVRRLDYLAFQIEELELIESDVDQAEALKERLVLMRDAHRWASFAAQAQHLLYESDDALASRLAALAEEARRGPSSSATLAEIGEQLEAAQIACEEAAHAASRLGNELEIEPAELDSLEERVHELHRLERKHGCSAAELVDSLDEMRREQRELESMDERLEQVEGLERALAKRCADKSARLHKARKRAAGKLSKAIEQELRALHIPKAKLGVRVDSMGGELGPKGADEVEFLFSANPGEELAPLSRVASGGELSRISLAIQVITAKKITVPQTGWVMTLSIRSERSIAGAFSRSPSPETRSRIASTSA